MGGDGTLPSPACGVRPLSLSFTPAHPPPLDPPVWSGPACPRTPSRSPRPPATSSFLIVLSLCLLAATSYSDPGIIPRQPRCTPPKNNHFRSYEVDGHRITEMWCTTCCFFRPPGCSHCRDCDNCVRDWDHHCPVSEGGPMPGALR